MNTMNTTNTKTLLNQKLIKVKGKKFLVIVQNI